MRRPILLTAALTAASADAFAPPPAPASLSSGPRAAFLPSPLAALSGHEPELVLRATEALRHAPALLSDASAAVADAVPAEAAEATGWWESYLQFMKGLLLSTHQVLDGPLRSVGVTQTWGPSIMAFTFGVRSLLLPLSLQQSRSSEYMKALKPYQDQISEKFADKEQVKNRAMAKLFEDAKQNPLAGCLFSLAQLPIFLGLYRAVRLLARDGALSEPFLWIPNLQGPVAPPTYQGLDWITTGWSDVDGLLTPGMGWETTLRFLIMPLILVLTQGFTMSVLTPPLSENPTEEEKKAADAQGFLKFLPLMIGFFSIQVPAGLTIYWLTSNVFTLSQSLGVKAYYQSNPPDIELPDYWDALDDVGKMTPQERRKAAEAGIQAGPSMDELVDEARFHYYVPRDARRESSDAWNRVDALASASVPSEMTDWVAAASAEDFDTNRHAAEAPSPAKTKEVSTADKVFFAD